MQRPGDDRRLFEIDRDLLSEAGLAADRAQALSAAEGVRDADLDSARMWRSRDDGLVVRGVKHHSAEKSATVGRAIGTVGSAMSGKWFDREHGLQYLELYSGPGRLLDEATGREQPGSPLEALAIPKPFTFYLFNDFSGECVDALRARVGARADVWVVTGSARQSGGVSHVGLL